MTYFKSINGAYWRLDEEFGLWSNANAGHHSLSATVNPGEKFYQVEGFSTESLPNKRSKYVLENPVEIPFSTILALPVFTEKFAVRPTTPEFV